MHQGWMSRIQAKKVFSHCCGTNRVRPCSTAAIAGLASSAALQYHCTVSSGSIGTPERSPCGTWWTCGSILLQQLEPLELGHDRLAGGEPVLAVQRRAGTASSPPISASVTRPSRSSTLGIARPCRWPTAKSLKSCAGVILTAPVPFSGSEYASATIGMRRPVSGRITCRPTRSR